MGPGAADIAEIIPEILQKLPALAPAPFLEPDQARFRLFDSISSFLMNAALSQPMLLVLDDLHWADKPSLLLLEFLARQMVESRILVVGTYRDMELSRQHPLSETLAQLSREPVFHREQLRGLSQEETSRFIDGDTGASRVQGLVESIHARTEGNPFFVIEVVRLMSDRQNTAVEDTAVSTEFSIPEGVRDVIGQRLNRLPIDCFQVLTTASVIGREFDFRLLNRLSDGISEDRLLEVLELSLGARIIEELPDTAGLHRFSHALIQQTLFEELSTTRRARLHARIGDALEEMYGSEAEKHASALAFHFAEAEAVSGSKNLVRYALIAGEQALATHAYEEALVHFQRALLAKEKLPEDSEMAAALFGLGRAQEATLGRQQLDLAFNSMGRAFEIYVGIGDVADAISVAEYPLHQIAGHHGGVDLVARALQLVDPNSQEAGRLLSRFVLGRGMGEGDYEGATEAFDKALAIAQRTGDLGLEMRTLAHSSNVDYWHLHLDETVAKGLRAIELAHRADDQLSEVAARFWVGIALINTGNSEEGRHHAEIMLSMAEGLRGHYWLATALWLNEFASRYEGDWLAAKEFNRRGLLVSPSDARLLVTRMVMEYEIGNMAEGNRYMEGLVETLRLVTSGPRYDHASAALMIPIVARITGTADRLRTAEEAAATVLSATSATPFITRYASWGLALIAVIRGDAHLAQEYYPALQSSAGTQLDGLSGDRVLGLVAQTIGEQERASQHYENALAFCRGAGYRPELAWTCCDYADALLAGNGPSDRTRATSLLDEALLISTELGMLPLMERVTQRLERLHSRPESAPANPGGLTQREIEVLRLIAAGKTDREISEDLFIGVRTVSTHVSNILNKINAANRTEAASYANQQGLV
jgi:DNA-binding CsgD family transcriptional regulator/tetratricopeptide (TPR) repeat protein